MTRASKRTNRSVPMFAYNYMPTRTRTLTLKRTRMNLCLTIYKFLAKLACVPSTLQHTQKHNTPTH